MHANGLYIQACQILRYIERLVALSKYIPPPLPGTHLLKNKQQQVDIGCLMKKKIKLILKSISEHSESQKIYQIYVLCGIHCG